MSKPDIVDEIGEFHPTSAALKYMRELRYKDGIKFAMDLVIANTENLKKEGIDIIPTDALIDTLKNIRNEVCNHG